MTRHSSIVFCMALTVAGCVQQPDASAADDVPLPAPTAPLDAELVAAGGRDFRNRGCAACHKIGEGRLVGPDLLGVTRRRSYEWYAAMVLHPDSMIIHDSTAMALLREYAIPMTNQRASPAQVRSIWEFLRDADVPPEPSTP